jgi:hypothetical protein
MLINFKNNYMIDYMELKGRVYYCFPGKGGLTLAGD